ncbi:MAG: sulfur carrier protein ThiS [Arenimonas sp.]
MNYNAHMQILLNGKTLDLSGSVSLTQLLEQHGYAQRRVAVEVNRSIVPKSRHAEHLLSDGDKVEIVHALGGG